MRPVRLTMQAFGPYPGREVVDFRRAMEGGLFGIYGPTGPGKSTIFSTLTFALFGEAAKAEQETTSLRSDHADPSVSTEVELVFEVGERRYFVRRSPEQMRPKQRGAGETTSPHEASLFDATGIAVEEISSANPGKVIAEKKTGAVRAAVTGVLGYGPEQFRQIVLLPQGKFESFLAAKTDERLHILRELFDVTTYRRLTEKFKQDAAAAESEVRFNREVCARQLKSEGFETAEDLTAGIEKAEARHRQALIREGEGTKAVDVARDALAGARKLEGLFVAAKRARMELEELLAQESEIEFLESASGMRAAPRRSSMSRATSKMPVSRLRSLRGSWATPEAWRRRRPRPQASLPVFSSANARGSMRSTICENGATTSGAIKRRWPVPPISRSLRRAPH